jgi:hypothetical protein
MLQFTIQEALDRTNIGQQALGCVIYLIRDGETIFYIGQSVSPLDRLQGHLGQDWHQQVSAVGRCIQKNAPDSDQWTIELYTLQDCGPFVQKHYECFGGLRMYDVSIAEQSMIQLFCPCLNDRHNPHPAPLPGQYLKV